MTAPRIKGLAGPADTTRIAQARASCRRWVLGRPITSTRAPFALLMLVLTFVVLVFPPLNWPDEHRNLTLLENGGYGIVYDAFQQAGRWMVSGFVELEPVGDFGARTVENPDWSRVHGELRYATQTLYAPPAYYVAKFATTILVVLVAFLITRVLSRGERTSAALYLTCLLTPAVAYQLCQVSTDATFILMSVLLYFVDTQRRRLLFTLAAAVLVVEDRSYGILAGIALATTVLPMILPWAKVRSRRHIRFAVVVGACLGGLAAGTLLANAVVSGEGLFLEFISSAPGFGDVQNALTYTWEKSYNPFKSPVILYAGLIYLPSASEFFLVTIPLFLVCLPLAFLALRIAVRDGSELGEKFFYLLTGSLLTFSLITGATHVFEHGRYYFTLIPLLVVAAQVALTRSREVYPAPRRVVVIALVAANLILTTLVAIVT